ncbi:unnamed protein product, partial [Discosporangium mesarthrocarpum]
MFRKKHDVAERSRSLLKSSAAKRIKIDILAALPSLTREVLDELIPNKDGIEVVKLASKALVYIHVPTKTPLFFDADGRGNIYPTVYALWATAGTGSSACCPSLVVHAPVSKFVLNGADIMLPGVVVRDPSEANYMLGERRCVVANGNPTPYAVGEMLRDSEGIVMCGMTGKGLKVMHCYLDFLWEMGPKTLPNEGFQLEGVLPVAMPAEAAPGVAAVEAAGALEPPFSAPSVDTLTAGCWEELSPGAEGLGEAHGAEKRG